MILCYNESINLMEVVELLLYHGSKSGIKGDVKPQSRQSCDFGCGFYMGDKPEQPKGLIASYENNKFYEIEYNTEGLKIKSFEDDYMGQIDWALFIAYNRQPEKLEQYKELCKRYREYNEMYDMIVGIIADDKMTQVMQLFFNGQMCDKAFIEAMQYVKLGNQYVLKTDEACKRERFNILKEYKLTDLDKKLIIAQNKNKSNELSNVINQIQTRYRRAQDVKFFDEIIEEWDK